VLRLAAFCALAGACAAAAADLGINVYGASYHFERAKARELGLTNEVNAGLGVRWRGPVQERFGERFDVFVDAGFYRDSARHTALLAGAAALWHAGERARLGAGLVLFKSPTYNRGDPFVAPAPLAAYQWRRATFNVVYFPKFGELNSTNQLGFWLTLWLQD
jgi:hypothetical protein